MTEIGVSLAELVRDTLTDLTRSERRVAQTLLANYPLQGLETVAQFAEQAGVSAPSVLRFVARIGFASYADFQRRLKEEVEARLQSPLAKTESATADADLRGQPHQAFAQAVADNVLGTFRHLPADELEAVAALIADGNRKRKAQFEDAARKTDATLEQVRLRFYQLAVERTQPGHWYQDSQGNWRKK